MKVPEDPRWLIAAVALCISVAAAPAAKVIARTGEITLATYGWAAVKHP